MPVVTRQSQSQQDVIMWSVTRPTSVKRERAHLASHVMWSTFAKYRKGEPFEVFWMLNLHCDDLLKGPQRRLSLWTMPRYPPRPVTWAPVRAGVTRSGLTPRTRGRWGAEAGGWEAATSSPTRMSRSGAPWRPPWSLTTPISTGGPGVRWVSGHPQYYVVQIFSSDNFVPSSSLRMRMRHKSRFDSYIDFLMMKNCCVWGNDRNNFVTLLLTL